MSATRSSLNPNAPKASVSAMFTAPLPRHNAEEEEQHDRMRMFHNHAPPPLLADDGELKNAVPLFKDTEGLEQWNAAARKAASSNVPVTLPPAATQQAPSQASKSALPDIKVTQQPAPQAVQPIRLANKVNATKVSTKDTALSTGAIIGIAAGSVVGFIVLAFLAYYFLVRGRPAAETLAGGGGLLSPAARASLQGGVHFSLADSIVRSVP
jgi:hypothetical protein